MFRFDFSLFSKIFKYLTFTFILICFFGVFNVKADTSMPINQSYFGIDIAEYNPSSPSTPNPRYIGSYQINGNNTQYAMLDNTGNTSAIMFRIFLYGDFKKDNYYTFTFDYDMGDLLEVYLTPLNTINNVSLFNGSDYLIQAENTSAIAENPRSQIGKIVVSFKATANSSSVRILLGDSSSWNSILLTNYSTQYQQGFRIKSVTGTYTEDLSNAYLGQITQQNQTIINQNNQTNIKLDQAEETRKGILQTIIDLPKKFFEMLISLFIPEDFSFLDNFKYSLANKLGFIAEIPISVIDFIFNLVNKGWDSFNSITLPEIEMFGVSFWNSQEISLQEAIDIFSPYKYITDVICVILCVNTLRRWYETFASGGDN